jgi:hypothetical protein
MGQDTLETAVLLYNRAESIVEYVGSQQDSYALPKLPDN